MNFAEAHNNWTVEDQKRVIWSDETKINPLGSDGKKQAWKLMIWGCMFWEGPGNATKIDGRMNADPFVSILDDELQESIKYCKKKPSDVLFQQDNDPKHKSKKAEMAPRQWIRSYGVAPTISRPRSH